MHCTHSACSFSGRVIGLANDPLFGLYCALVGPNPSTLRMAANELLDLLCFSYVWFMYLGKYFSARRSLFSLKGRNRFLRNIDDNAFNLYSTEFLPFLCYWIQILNPWLGVKSTMAYKGCRTRPPPAYVAWRDGTTFLYTIVDLSSQSGTKNWASVLPRSTGVWASCCVNK